ncbi:MAG: alpha/beta fold hydrolase [Chloroflexi bacterium]|nr:alpha/beta fold hydrolase [Chloroflexota bacterium]
MTTPRVAVPVIVAAVLLASLAASACSDDDKKSEDAATVTPSTSPVAATRPDSCPEAVLPPGTELGSAELLWTSDCIPFVRTPEERFEDLPDFPYEAHYADVGGGLRMAYVDEASRDGEGSRDGDVVLLLHGEPSWGYLYRKMIPPLVDAGYRVIAPDMIGMGRSDKPVQFADYSYLQHVQWVEAFIAELGLTDITVFVQDWGSLIGLRVVGDKPDLFARVVVANGRLPVVPEGLKLVTFPDPPLPDDALALPFDTCDEANVLVPHFPAISECFAEWAVFALTGTAFHPSEVIEALTAVDLLPEERAAYDAPFPERIYISGPRVFPSLINTLGGPPNNAAAREVFNAWTKPLLTLFGRLDENLGTDAVQAEMRDTVPGAQGQPHHFYPDAHHFIQEDKGADLAARVVEFMSANPLPQ